MNKIDTFTEHLVCAITLYTLSHLRPVRWGLLSPFYNEQMRVTVIKLLKVTHVCAVADTEFSPLVPQIGALSSTPLIYSNTFSLIASCLIGDVRH